MGDQRVCISELGAESGSVVVYEVWTAFEGDFCD